MTRTDAIIAAVTARLEENRSALDAAPDLRLVSVVVRLAHKTGQPCGVILRTEAEGDLTKPKAAAIV